MEQEKKNAYRKKIMICIIMAIWTTIAFTIRSQAINMEDVYTWANSKNAIVIYIAKWRAVMNGYGMQNAMLTIMLAYCYYKIMQKIGKIRICNAKLELLLACFFSLCMILGQAFQVNNSLKYVFSGFFYCSVTVVRFIGYTFFFFLVVYWIVCQLYDKENKAFLRNKKVGKVSFLVFEKYPFIAPFVILIICWLPYMIACFPGVVQWDGLRQLTNAFHLNGSDNSHPIFTTLLMGMAMKLGRVFGSDNLGVFFYILPQMFIVAGITAYSIKEMRNMKIPYWMRWITLCYYSFVSLWPLYAVSMFKDTLFYIIFLAYIILLIESLLKNENFWKKKKKLFVLCIVMILLILIRPNGIHIIVLSMPFAIIAGWHGWKNYRGWICIILSIIVYAGFNNILLPMLGVSEGRVQEAFCIPFQQTARYICEYSDEVTEDEEKIISNVLDYKKIAESYNPEFVDPVKSLYKSEASDEDIVEYFKVWFKQLCKHPGVYIEATLNGSYGYFFPNKTEYREGLGAYAITYDPAIYTGEFDISMFPQLNGLRKTLENLSYIVRTIPMIGLVFSNGIYTWIILLCIVILLKKYNWRYITPYIPVLIVILFCVASPVNAYIRYMRPVMVSTPMLISWMFFLCNHNNGVNIKQEDKEERWKIKE